MKRWKKKKMNIDQVKKIFEQNNQKFTKQRQIVFKALQDSEAKHITPEELFSEIHLEHKQVGIATVYRTLNIFEELGIVNKQEFTDNAYTYELIDKNHEHHDHLICTNCGKIIEVECIDSEEMRSSLSEKYDFELDYYSLRIYGTCSDCRNNKE